MLKNAPLEIQWDSNSQKSQKPLYHVQILVKKVKLDKGPRVRWILPVDRRRRTILGQITHSELKEKQLLLLLPLHEGERVREGNLLDLFISERLVHRDERTCCYLNSLSYA